MVKVIRLTNNVVLITQEDERNFIAQPSSIIIPIELLKSIMKGIEDDYTGKWKSWSWKDNIFKYVGGRISEAE